MSKSIRCPLSSQWFAKRNRLAYWLAREWVRKLLWLKGFDCNANEVAELAQDAVCRGYDRFAKRCAQDVCGASDRRPWVCQCVICGVRDAIRAKSSFGTVSTGVAIRDDAMNRFKRVRPSCVHGRDDEKQDALEQVQDKPVQHPVQRWELEEQVERDLPQPLHKTALYAALGLTQETSASLQGVTDRTIRTRLQQIRAFLNPDYNAYALTSVALKVI